MPKLLTALLTFAAAAAAQKYRIDPVAGNFLSPGASTIGTPGAGLGNPRGIAVDAAGNLYIAAQDSNQIYVVSAAGVLLRTIGTGVSGYAGDGGPAAAAQLRSPYAVAFDSLGNLYIADTGNNVVREVAAGTNIITTVAGSFVVTPRGDGGPATSANLNSPRGVAVDSAGVLYIADSGNNAVRRVSGGIIDTVPGTTDQLLGPAAVAVDAARDLYFMRGNSVYKAAVATGGGAISAVPGPAGNSLVGMAVGGGAVYLAYLGPNRIQKVTGGTIVNFAGIGTSGFSGDGGPALAAQFSVGTGMMAVDPAGNVYVIDGNRIRRILAANGIISTVAGNGSVAFNGDGIPATAATLSRMEGVAVDGAGNLYIADTANHRIRRIAATTGVITTIAGTGFCGFSGDGGAATAAMLCWPHGLAFDPAGDLYIADLGNACVRKIKMSSGVMQSFAGNGGAILGDGGPALSASVSLPGAIAFDPFGNAYIAQPFDSRVRKVAAGTNIITTFAGTGVSAYAGDGGPATLASLSIPQGVATDSAGNIYIGELQRIRKIAAGTNLISTITGPFPSDSLTSSIAVAGETVYIADAGNRIKTVPTSGGPFTTIAGNGIAFGGLSGDGGLALNAALMDPRAITVDAAGNVFFADTGNRRIRKLTPVQTAAVTIASNPAGIPLQVDGVTLSTPATFDWIAGSSHELAAPSTIATFSGPLSFVSWNQGGAASQTITAPAAPTTYTATYACAVSLGSASFLLPFSGASSAVGVGSICSWTAVSNASWLAVTSGSSGAGNGTVAFTAALNPNPTPRSATIQIGNQTFTVLQSATPVIGGLRFVPANPCRIADTRLANGPFGGPALSGGVPRQFDIVSGACGVPPSVAAYSLNLTVAPLGPVGFLSIWPAGQSQPVVSTLNSSDGRVKANAAIVPAGVNAAVSVYASGPTHVIIDVNGYFVPATGPQDLAFYSIAPCRLADTRFGSGSFGQPSLAAQAPRTLPVLSGPCGIPATAKAYATNMTVVPHGALGFLSAWPAGQSQPVVSTLNALTGAITANMAIVPAGVGGAISVFATDDTDLIVDITGYFAPPGAPGSMDFYAVSPCRISDTRNPVSAFGGPVMGAAEARSLPVPSSACGIPAGAAAYSLNATVVPPAPLGFLGLWGSGPQPFVSTLNSGDGSVVANAAITPAGANGAVTAFTSNPSHLILDINGYFK